MAECAELEPSIKTDLMAKRSLMQRALSVCNFKNRWFVLSTNYLRYCLGSIQTGIGKTKGVIPLTNIQFVGVVYPEYFENKSRVFQVVFTSDETEAHELMLLYIQAPHEEMKSDWIRAIRTACANLRVALSKEYHVGAYHNGKYLCCQETDKQGQGCTIDTSEDNFESVAETSQPAEWSTSSSCDVKFKHDSGGSKELDIKVVNNTNETSRSSNSVKATKEKVVPNTNKTNKASNSKVYSHLCSNNDSDQDVYNSPGPVRSISSEDRTDSLDYSLEKSVIQVSVLYPYQAKQAGELCLVEGESYVLLDDSDKSWWKVRDKNGDIGKIPSNFVTKMEDESSEKKMTLKDYDWYHQQISRTDAVNLLMADGREGCFLVRDSEKSGHYSVSFVNNGQVKHYRILKNDKDMFYIQNKSPFATVPELIEFYKHNKGLATVFMFPPSQSVVLDSISNDATVIHSSDLRLLEDLWAGEEGRVVHGKYKELDVAIKIPNKQFSSPLTKFIAEAKILSKLQHENLVQLIGICVETNPIYIVTEYLAQGNLLSYLRIQKAKILSKKMKLLDFCGQVCKGMEYLEEKQLVHRDLAARSCLLGNNFSVKVANFGFTRFLDEDGCRFSVLSSVYVQWAAPEAIQENRFSTKSDVWSFGVLMWEVFTGGDQPFEGLPSHEVIKMVCKDNARLSRPTSCPEAVYKIMLSCWHLIPSNRPSFSQLYRDLDFICTNNND